MVRSQRDADAICDSHQRDVWGRCLWGDETRSLRNGIATWTTVNFKDRCLGEGLEYAPAMAKVKERYPNAVFHRDVSKAHFGFRDGPTGGEWANYYFSTRLMQDS